MAVSRRNFCMALTGGTLAKNVGDEVFIIEPDASKYTVKTATGTAVRRLEDRFSDVVNVIDFGAKGDGITDDTLAIQTALSVGALHGRTVYFPQGRSWYVSRLTIPSNSRIITGHSIFIHDGSSYFITDNSKEKTEFYPVFRVNENVIIDSIEIVFPDKKISSGVSDGMVGIVVLGDNFHADELSFVYNSSNETNESKQNNKSTANNNGIDAYGIYVLSNNSYIGFIKSKNIHRPICYGKGEANICHDVFLGGYDIEAYKRALKFKRVSRATIGTGIARKRPSNVGIVKNGWNGILLEECENITFSNCEIDDSPEHGIRFGGKFNKNICFSDVVLKRNGGSAIKLNSHASSTAENVDAKVCENISFGNVTVYDNRYIDPEDDITLTKRGEILRISHADSVSFASFSAFADISVTTGSTVIAINNSNKIFIQEVSVENYSGVFLHINEKNDTTDFNNTSNFTVNNLRLLNCSISDSNATSKNFVIFNIENSSISNIIIDIKSDTLYRYIFSCPTPTTGIVENIRFIGVIHNGNFRFPTPCYHRESLFFDLSIGKKKAFGPGNNNFYLIDFYNISHFDPNIDDINGGLFIRDAINTSDNNVPLTFGGAINFSKPGSGGRRGAAIASIQTGKETRDTGLAVFSGTANTAMNILKKGWIFDHAGNFRPYTTIGGSLGSSGHLWSNIFSETSAIGSSDERLKDNINDPSEALMRAWGNVKFKVFQFKHSIMKKGVNTARLHIGIIAQEIIKVFASEGLDALRYGIVCYDSLENQDETHIIVDDPAVIDHQGNEVKSAVTHLETTTISTGDHYGIRYEEALALECAYQRYRAEQAEARISALEERLAQLEARFFASSKLS